jgi:hypothetical protein
MYRDTGTSWEFIPLSEIPYGVYLETVATDTSITGDGTPGNPLAVVPSTGVYIEAVSTNDTLTGDGTTGSPLSVKVPGSIIKSATATLPKRSNLKIIGATISDDSTADTTVVTMSGGGHTIKSSDATLPQRANLKIVGATVTDDSGADATLVTITGGSGSGGSGDAVVAGSDYILVRDEKSSGTPGGSPVVGTWQTRELTQIVSDTGGHCSLADNQITLAPGTYICRIQVPAYYVNRHKAVLHSITDGTDILIGSSAHSEQGSGATLSTSEVIGKIVLTVETTFEIRHQCQFERATYGLGVNSSFGVPEIYTIAEFWRQGASGSGISVFKRGAETIVSASVAEEIVFPAVAIGASRIGANGAIRTTLMFDLRHDTTCSTTFRFKYGEAIMASFYFDQGDVDANRPTKLDMLIANTDSETSQRWFLVVHYKDGSYKQFSGLGTGAADTTVAQAFSVTVQHSVANANNTYKQYYALVEIL